MKLCWITIRVADVETSLHFYHDILGLPVDSRRTMPGHDMVMLGESKMPKVELMYSADAKPGPGAGMTIGFNVDSLQEAIELMKSNGVQIVGGPMSPNPHLSFFFVKDPDGYTVQLVEQK
jgi:lactoylglutathione lyase